MKTRRASIRIGKTKFTFEAKQTKPGEVSLARPSIINAVDPAQPIDTNVVVNAIQRRASQVRRILREDGPDFTGCVGVI